MDIKELEQLKEEKEKHLELIHDCRKEGSVKDARFLNMLLNDQERTEKEIKVIDTTSREMQRNRDYALLIKLMIPYLETAKRLAIEEVGESNINSYIDELLEKAKGIK